MLVPWLQHPEDGLALEASEFWAAFCDAAADPGILRPFLPRLVPILLHNMVYDEFDDEVADAEAAEEAAGVPDRDEDVKPFIHRRGTAK